MDSNFLVIFKKWNEGVKLVYRHSELFPKEENSEQASVFKHYSVVAYCSQVGFDII